MKKLKYLSPILLVVFTFFVDVDLKAQFPFSHAFQTFHPFFLPATPLQPFHPQLNPIRQQQQQQQQQPLSHNSHFSLIPLLSHSSNPFIHHTSVHHSTLYYPGKASGAFPQGPLGPVSGVLPQGAFAGIDPNYSPSLLRADQCKYFNEPGVCHSHGECLSNGGSLTTYCRDYTKFCCMYRLTCKGGTSADVSYFRNPKWPLYETIRESCGVTIQRTGGHICYLKASFLNLILSASTGYCDGIGLDATAEGSAGKRLETICGDQSKKSLYIDFGNADRLSVTLNTNQPMTRMTFKILLEQIPCGETPGTMWPGSGSTPGGPVPPQHNPTQAPTQAPLSPGYKEPGVGAPGSNAGASKHQCGISYDATKASNVRDKGQMGNRGRPSSIWDASLRAEEEKEKEREEEEEEEEECERGRGNCVARNPLLTSRDWDVPTVNESLLFKYAGYQLPITTRITFGLETQPHEYPWSIAMYRNGRYHCGASLISDTHVLTAAHCVIKYKRRPSALSLVIGDWNIQSATDGPNIRRQIKKIITHPGYSTVTLKFDLAVVILKKKVPLSDTIRAICLPSSDLNLENKIITVTGWGRNEKNKLMAKLMQHSAAVVSNKFCNDRWAATGAPSGVIADTMLCMSPQDGDSCKGDSGGPAIYEDPPNSNRFVQVGIVSFGSASCTDKNLPGVYTKVPKVSQWIKDQMKLN